MTYKDCPVCGILMTVMDTKYRDGRPARYCPNCKEVHYTAPQTWDEVTSGHMTAKDEAPEYDRK